MGRPPRVTRDDLLQAARRIFGEKGFDAATLADIASLVGVTPAAVLRHFESKQALFRAAMQSGVKAPPKFILDLAFIDAATADPREVLRSIAEQFVPFAQRAVAENIAVYMHSRSQRHLVVPFDADAPDSPPRRGLALVGDYFRRAMAAGRIRTFEPRAAALLFMGALHSYVTLHHIFNVAAKPYPLPRYIDALIDLWTEGAIVTGGTRGKNRNHRSSRADRLVADRRSRRHSAVGAPDPPAAGDRPVRNARGTDRKRGVAGRRPGRSRSNR
jgi:AcrR family transcriptional regulator